MNKLYEKRTYNSERASSFDVTGANHDYVKVPAGEVKSIVLEGSGIIKHIWTTFLHEPTKNNYHSLHIKIEFDGQEPSVDMSIADFFGLQTGNIYDINSVPIQVSRTMNHPLKELFEVKPYRGAMNCYWEMPFLHNCKISLINYDSVEVGWYYHIDWERHETIPEDILYFHATHSTEMTNVLGKMEEHGATDFDEIHYQDEGNYVFCDIKGYEGHYVGITLMVDAKIDCRSSWWEGDDMFVVDDETWPPSIHGTGLEDYFGLAYGFRVVDCRPQYGISYIEKDTKDDKQVAGICCMYRFHLDTPIVFHKSLKGSFEHGHANKTDATYSSVAYWYGRKI